MPEYLLRIVISLPVAVILLVTLAAGQHRNADEPSPEMTRLVRAFAGSYTTVEHHQPHAGFPNGGIRRGTDVIRSAAGCNAMITEVYSHSPERDLDYTGVYWWDPSAGVYRLLMCAKQFPEGCLSGATARWEGEKFVRTRE